MDRGIKLFEAVADELGWAFKVDEQPEEYTTKVTIYLTKKYAILCDTDTIDPLFLTLKTAVGHFVVDVFAMPGAGRDERGTPVWKFRRELYERLEGTLKSLGFKVRTKVA